MNLQLYIGDLDGDGLTTLLTSLRPTAPYAILQRVDAIDFPAREETFDPTQWEEGRIFGPGLDFHWQRKSEAFRVVLTREDGGESGGLALVPVPDGLRREEHTYYLWGEDESRVGRSVRYRCLAGSGRPQLTVAEFYDEDGRLYHWRYVAMGRQA